jgi:hypothetical protein
VCEDDLVLDVSGNCVDACDLISCHPTARCQEQGAYASCVCDLPEVMTNAGRCELPPPTYPCEPNPCQSPTSRCVVRDGEVECECPNPGDQPPDCSSGCSANHFDGDELEPNDCPEDATLITTGTALTRVDADFGPELDDVDRFSLVEQNGWYWVLLQAPVAVCELDFATLPASEPFAGCGFGVQLDADENVEDWVCRYDGALADQVAYSLAIIHFPSEGDLPEIQDDGEMQEPETSMSLALVEGRSIANRFDEGDDVDTFAFAAELPVSLSFTGQRAALSIEVFDAEGMPLSNLSVECGFSLEASPCADIQGSGDATVRIQARESEQAEQRELDAWRLDW